MRQWLILLFFFPIVGLAAPTMNLTVLKKQILHYHDSGQYQQAIEKVADRARHYLKHRIIKNNRSKHPKKLAMVLDIDETSLSNYPFMKVMDFGGSMKQINAHLEQANDPPILPMRRLYRYAIRHGVKVFFVTGRFEKYRAATKKNLHSAGYQGWSGLYMKPNDYHLQSSIPLKRGARRAIEQKGYDIVVSIGDQMSDLIGGYADKTFKYPNYICHFP